jgi:hypothetical protein
MPGRFNIGGNGFNIRGNGFNIGGNGFNIRGNGLIPYTKEWKGPIQRLIILGRNAN